MKTIYSDFLVLGSGLAGMTYAENVCKHGKTILICKSDLEMTNTFHAQGGIACVLSKSDNFESHIQDTLIAGDGLCNSEAVRFMVSKAPAAIESLIDLGVKFDGECQQIELGLEGGHSNRRIVHSKDETGREVQTKLLKRLSKNDIEVFPHHQAFKLLVYNNICQGVLALDLLNDEIIYFSSKIVFLATGGAGQIFLHTTNPEIATGDGVALAYEAGGKIKDMEFIQFHPTCLYQPGEKPFLITEALRGFGAELKLMDGGTFMKNYHPLGSLAPRDIVARAIMAEMQKSSSPHVNLDLSETDLKEAEFKFPNIFKTCRSKGIDPAKGMIPVVPAAHYICGGVITDLKGKTSIHNLYAAGEVACTGVHGANRLASNSLLEAAVFGKEAAFDSIKNLKHCKVSSEQIKYKRSDKAVHLEKIASMKVLLQKSMWEYAGIKRTTRGLQLCLKVVSELENEVHSLYPINIVQKNLIELRNLIAISQIILKAAIQRKENKGGHFNEDFFNEDAMIEPIIIK